MKFDTEIDAEMEAMHKDMAITARAVDILESLTSHEMGELLAFIGYDDATIARHYPIDHDRTHEQERAEILASKSMHPDFTPPKYDFTDVELDAAKAEDEPVSANSVEMDEEFQTLYDALFSIAHEVAISEISDGAELERDEYLHQLKSIHTWLQKPETRAIADYYNANPEKADEVRLRSRHIADYLLQHHEDEFCEIARDFMGHVVQTDNFLVQLGSVLADREIRLREGKVPDFQLYRAVMDHMRGLDGPAR